MSCAANCSWATWGWPKRRLTGRKKKPASPARHFDRKSGMTKRGQLLFFLPALGIVAVFLLLPSALTLVESFFAEKPGGPAFIGLGYYQSALTDPKFLLSL